MRAPIFIPLVGLLVAGCDSPEAGHNFRVDCPDPGTTTTTTTTSAEESTSTGEEPPPPPPPPPPTAVPQPTAACPDLSTSGTKSFCPSALDSCRSVSVFNAENATGSGPGVLWWHGTGQTPGTILNGAANGPGGQLRAMITGTGGILFVPAADPAALARPGNPFPWWVVCLVTNPSECTRPDDFILTDEIMACAVEQQTADPERLGVGGFSAGGMMTAHLVDRVGYFAGAVSYSGGLPAAYQPTTPPGPTAVMSIHGGATDQYTGVGMPQGQSYPFQVQSEEFAVDMSNAGRFAFNCNHRAGHQHTFSDQGALFLSLAHQDGHPWSTYVFGYPGTGPSWFLNNRCYAAGAPAQ